MVGIFRVILMACRGGDFSTRWSAFCAIWKEIPKFASSLFVLCVLRNARCLERLLCTLGTIGITILLILYLAALESERSRSNNVARSKEKLTPSQVANKTAENGSYKSSTPILKNFFIRRKGTIHSHGTISSRSERSLLDQFRTR